MKPEGVLLGETYFPTGVDLANGDSVSMTVSWSSDGTVSIGGIAVDTPWKYGDILQFDNIDDVDFLYLCPAEDPDAVDPIWVMSLTEGGGWSLGSIVVRNRRIFHRVEAV